MACLLQPECNFLHGYFRYKLPVEVVDMEVKVTSLQGMHIFRRDQMTQLVRCILLTPNLCLYLNMIKKMKTFLEVENKMGPIISALANQYRLPLPETNPNIIKSDATKKRKRVRLMTHTARIRGVFDVANSPRYRVGIAPMLFQWSHSHIARFSSRIRRDFFPARFFCPRPLFIARFFVCRVNFPVQTGCTAVCFP